MKQTKKEKWLTIRIDESIDKRLDNMKKTHGVSKQYFVKLAIVEKLKSDKL